MGFAMWCWLLRDQQTIDDPRKQQESLFTVNFGARRSVLGARPSGGVLDGCQADEIAALVVGDV